MKLTPYEHKIASQFISNMVAIQNRLKFKLVVNNGITPLYIDKPRKVRK